MRLILFFFATILTADAAIDPARLEAARQLYGERKNTEARQAFEELRTQDANAAEPVFFLGLLAMRRDEPELAAQLHEKAVALRPHDSEYHRRLGDAYGRAAQKAGTFSKIGWARKCRVAYEKAVQLDPSNLQARTSMMTFYEQAPGFVGGGMDKAHAEAEAIMKLDTARGRLAKAGLYVRERKFAQAFEIYEEAVKQNPDDYASLYQIGRIAAETGQNFDRGMEALKRCLTLRAPEGAPEHGAVHWRMGNIHEKKGDQAAARVEYETALKLDPNFTPATEAMKKFL